MIAGIACALAVLGVCLALGAILVAESALKQVQVALDRIERLEAVDATARDLRITRQLVDDLRRTTTNKTAARVDPPETLRRTGSTATDRNGVTPS